LNNNISVNKCSVCGGGGIVNGNTCSNCQGIGYLATDGVNEYYLGLDNSGKPIITGIKEKTIEQSQNTNVTRPVKKSDIRIFLIIIFEILSAGIIAILYFVKVIELKLFVRSEIFIFGILILTILLNNSLYKFLRDKAISMFFKEPNDFLKELRK